MCIFQKIHLRNHSIIHRQLVHHCKPLTSINALKSLFFNKYKIKDIGKFSLILRIRIKRDIKQKQLAIDQSTYIKKTHSDFNIEDRNAVSTPIDNYHVLTLSESSEPPTNIVEHQIWIGIVIYVIIGTRPDIVFVIYKLSQYSQTLFVRHQTVLDGVLWYLKKTVDLTLVRIRAIPVILHALKMQLMETTLLSKSQYLDIYYLLETHRLRWLVKNRELSPLSQLKLNMILYIKQIKILSGSHVGSISLVSVTYLICQFDFSETTQKLSIWSQTLRITARLRILTSSINTFEKQLLTVMLRPYRYRHKRWMPIS